MVSDAQQRIGKHPGTRPYGGCIVPRLGGNREGRLWEKLQPGRLRRGGAVPRRHGDLHRRPAHPHQVLQRRHPGRLPPGGGRGRGKAAGHAAPGAARRL